MNHKLCVLGGALLLAIGFALGLTIVKKQTTTSTTTTTTTTPQQDPRYAGIAKEVEPS